MRVPKLEVKPQGLGSLISEIENGHIRIPRFQREFVWRRSDILKLLDSMYNEYPIGTIFLWNAPAEHNSLLRNVEELDQPPLLSNRGYKIILDGQQRLTSLYAVIKGLQIYDEDYSKFVVDLGNDNESRSSFVYQKTDNRRWVSVCQLLAADPFVVYNSLPNDEHMKRFTDFRSRLSEYPFSVVTVDDVDIENAIEIFERINRQGRKLSRYDLISASVSEQFDLRQRSETDIINRHTLDFGEIEETSIPQALALNQRGRTDHNTQLNLSAIEIKGVWSDTVKCFSLAIEFVQKNLGVSRKSFLPYDAILPLLAFYFYRTGSKPIADFAHREQLEYWFWQSTFSQRYTDKSQSRMNEDAAWLKQLIMKDTPFPQLTIADEDDLIEGSMSRTTSAIRNGILCLYNLKRPLHFTNRMEINLGATPHLKFSRAEKHHIFPAAFLRSKSGYDSQLIDSIPNFCFVPADLRQLMGDRSPSEYMTEIRSHYDGEEEFGKVMRTHLIPVSSDSGIWHDDYSRFLQQRAKLLVKEIRYLCGITLKVEQEMFDPIVNRIEIALRDNIHNTMIGHGVDYWKDTVPGDVQTRINNAVNKHIKKTPGSSRRDFSDARQKLDLCDVSDYSKIIVNGKNWKLFVQVFRSKSDCVRYLDDFREFRAAIKHNREVSDILELRAQAAILWLRDALDIDLNESRI